VREKRWIQVRFHGGQIDSVVFKTGMVAHDQKTQHREEQNARQL